MNNVLNDELVCGGKIVQKCRYNKWLRVMKQVIKGCMKRGCCEDMASCSSGVNGGNVFTRQTYGEIFNINTH